MGGETRQKDKPFQIEKRAGKTISITGKSHPPAPETTALPGIEKKTFSRRKVKASVTGEGMFKQQGEGLLGGAKAGEFSLSWRPSISSNKKANVEKI